MSEELATLAETALVEGNEESVLPLLAEWLDRKTDDVLIWHWTGLLQRSLDRQHQAIGAFEAALYHAPAHPGITHALAHTLLEAGLPSTARFIEAIKLAPGKPEIRLGLAAARYADGEGERGLEELRALLGANAGWYEGHRKYAQLASMVGCADQALTTVEQALSRFPDSRDLYSLGIELLAANDHAAALSLIERGIKQLEEVDFLLWAKAAALDELHGPEASAALFASLGTASNQAHAIMRIRHGLRRGEWNDTASQIEPWLTRDQPENVWPYAALAWRLADDPRWQWLEGRSGLTAAFDLPPDAIDLYALTSKLQALHNGSGRFLNQSVRHGTQTDGPLFARTDSVLVRVRETMREAVNRFAKALPPDDGSHPALRGPRDRRKRFAGSWSVRLTGSGYHSSHHHPQGWLSAVLYVAVPQTLSGQEGQLVLGGSPDDLGLPIHPLQIVQPRPGRLVIFPSIMWHGTLPFNEGERLTIAFDVARP